jgi:hypothetical protein
MHAMSPCGLQDRERSGRIDFMIFLRIGERSTNALDGEMVDLVTSINGALHIRGVQHRPFDDSQSAVALGIRQVLRLP